MINLRLNPFSSTEEEVFAIPGEDIRTVVEWALREKGFKAEDFERFHVLLNGKIIDPIEQESTPYIESDNILITPQLHGGDFGQIFKTVAVIVAAVVVSVVTSGAGAGPAWTAAATAAASIGTTLLLNSLIPPEEPGLGSLGGVSDSIDSSQMFTLSGQSNKATPFKVVPKVYGTFKMFPTVAAQPYTSIDVDASSGKQVQMLNIIYDFGLGPMVVRDLKIGDTPIENFDDVEYRFVDPNKPLTDEGEWDAQVENTFQIYKGDVNIAPESVAINKNREGDIDVGAEADYQIIRNGPTNSEDVDSEITVNLTFPSGLYSFSSYGEQGTATVELELDFAPIGTENWKPYNDLNEVYSFRSTGGVAAVLDNDDAVLYPFDKDEGLYQALYAEVQTNEVYSNQIYYRRYSQAYGLPKGTNVVYTANAIPTGHNVILDGTIVGKAQSSIALASGYAVTLDKNLTRNFQIFNYIRYEIKYNFTTPPTDYYEGSTTGRIYDSSVILSKGVVTASDRNQYYVSFSFKPRTKGSYKVRVRRVRTSYQYTQSRNSQMFYIGTTTHFNTPAIKTTKRHTFVEMKIRATNQLNGTLDTLNGIVSSVLPVYDDNTETWNLEETNNPAWIIADILTGSVNRRAVGQDRLHLPSIVEFAEFADEIPVTPPTNDAVFGLPRFTCGFILDFSITVRDMINTIGASCQATLNLIDGQYGILIDKQKTIPVQLFTPRNYRDFSSTRTYAETAEGVKVKYTNPADNWRITEFPVYADGYNENNLTDDLEELTAFGVTNEEQAWRFGRYMLAQAILRQERITFTVDFEHLVCTRGDYVQFTQDSMLAGGRPARVKSVSGSEITIDESIDTNPLLDYGYVFRGVSSIEESTLTPIDSQTFDLDGPLPSVGDLIVIGEVDTIVLDCIVKSIIPQDDLSATVVLVEKADGVYDSYETGTIPEYSAQITNANGVEVTPPGEVVGLEVAESSYEVGQEKFDYFTRLNWERPTEGSVADSYEVYVNKGDGYNFEAITKELTYKYIIDEDRVGDIHYFKVLAVSSSGKKLNLGEVGDVNDIPQRKTTSPADVTSLSLNITNQVIQLTWPLLPLSEGIARYSIRYNPTLEGIWFNSTPLTTTDARTSFTSVQGRKGTYLIKAVDFEGNESDSPALAITSIPELFDLNLIEEINDDDTWAGTKDRVEVIDGDLVLEKVNDTDFYAEGYYYYTQLLDLGENFTTRVQSLVEAGDFSLQDLMIDWDTLANVEFLSTSSSADWDVEAQVRFNDQVNFIVNWNPLSDVTTMNEGDTDDWKPYASFINGDFTARYYQFRLKLSSYLRGVSPRVRDGLIRADMPDRIESAEDLTSDVAGTNIVFDPPFKGPGTFPSLQITQDNATQGDYYKITGKSLNGFTITFYDSTGTPVVRTFDWYAKGFGRRNDTYI